MRVLREVSGAPREVLNRDCTPRGYRASSHPRGVTTPHPGVGESHSGVTGYEIRVKGSLGETTRCAFEEFTAAVRPAETVMRGEIRDQAELHAVLGRLQSLGLELIEVRRLSSSPENR
jgi:hypothetical protein